jgi:hypothetical protein
MASYTVNSGSVGIQIQNSPGTLTAMTMNSPPSGGYQLQRYAPGDQNPLPTSGVLCLLDQNAGGNRILFNSDMQGIISNVPFLTGGTMAFTALYVQSVPHGCTVSVTTA